MEAVDKCLDARLAQAGYRIARFDALPLKQLAVRSGLARYGRNNLAYVQGMGSFLELRGYYTDMPCPDAATVPLRRMEGCGSCLRCIGSCPTQAIRPGCTVIDAERCLTYFNEFIDLAPFPEWIAETAHNSLHGCMCCQLACPANRDALRHENAAVSFDEAQTRCLLETCDFDALPLPVREKIAYLQLTDYVPLLPRNLSVLLAQPATI